MWDETSRTFSPGGDNVNAMRVLCNHEQEGHFFGRLFGHDEPAGLLGREELISVAVTI